MAMENDEMTYRIALSNIRGMGVDLARKLLDVTGDERTFFDMDERRLRSITGSRSRIYQHAYRQEMLAKARREMEYLSQHPVRVRYFTDTDYPYRLLQAEDAPLVLYTAGECNLNARHIVSVVGTRHATAYGIRICQELIADLAQKLPGTVIVSGLAYGIDITAHRAAMQAGLPTVAVMASGLNTIYPAAHRNDAAAMVRHGGMTLTEYTSQDVMHRGNFLARNRIIAGLSDCTVVVESAATGGALVTASLAMSYNRDVFAVPGRVNDEFSRGCNRLVQSNQAAVVTCADDLLAAMNWEPVPASAEEPVQRELFPELTQQEQAVVDALRELGEVHINDLSHHLKLPVYQVMATLVELDCRHVVMALPGSRYSL